MKKNVTLLYFLILSLLGVSLLSTSCIAPQPSTNNGLKVVAVESFLTDITQNITGNRANVESLIPINVDPHSFEPTPQDVVKVADSKILIINGSGLETWLNVILQNAGGNYQMIEASKGLVARTPRPEEMALLDPAEAANDPHFWLDPNNVIHYVENIRDGLILADPARKDTYTANAANYSQRLIELDTWIKSQVSLIPVERRLLVTNHESLGYFADRYGFQVIGTIFPGTSSVASPSALDLARLIDKITSTRAPAIFLEVGTNVQLADQINRETGIKIVENLYVHSLSGPDGPAPDYITMMKYNTTIIVEALK
jgi:ABC-type Zn uptake system ZnuABC Zn-binding protein ZnuA